MPDEFCKFVHQLFNVKCKVAHLQLFDVSFSFSEKHIFRKQKRTTVYERTSISSDFKLTRKNDYCYLRNINKFLRYRTLWTSILKCRFSTKGIELARFVFFEVLGVPQLWCVPLTFSYHLCYLRISNVSSMIHHGSVEWVQVKECYFMFRYTFLDFCDWILTSININRILTNENLE